MTIKPEGLGIRLRLRIGLGLAPELVGAVLCLVALEGLGLDLVATSPSIP